MELLYSEEHLRCINYDQDKNPIVEVISVEKDELWENLPLGNKLIFLLDGEISFSFGKFTNCRIRKDRIIYLPGGYRFVCKGLESSTFIVVCVQGHTYFCEDYHFKDLEKMSISMPRYPNQAIIEPATLEINEAMARYLESLLQYIGAGAKCKSFYQIKIKELFYIFRWFYPKEALIDFFQSSLRGGSQFTTDIMNNWAKYKSVGDMAEAMNYTVSGFEKRFKRVFGVSPYRWMINQKAERIFHQVRMTDLTFKQISSDFGFTSLSRFNDFCKTNFGKPPGYIRGNDRIGENDE